ncbi:nitroreductase family protein [Flavobacterium sp. GT2N3]|uniref:nitroreductase family protein n=1 Tax=Flavobacterium sp. GT2N3 TaxID=3401733 RepID=UPI003AAB2401
MRLKYTSDPSVFLKKEAVKANKSPGLATQNFRINKATINYDMCPMGGFDSLRIKKILHLPARSNINMILGRGIKEE